MFRNGRAGRFAANGTAFGSEMRVTLTDFQNALKRQDFQFKREFLVPSGYGNNRKVLRNSQQIQNRTAAPPPANKSTAAEPIPLPVRISSWTLLEIRNVRPAFK